MDKVVIVHTQPDGRLEYSEPMSREEAVKWLPPIIKGLGELLPGESFRIADARTVDNHNYTVGSSAGGNSIRDFVKP